MILLPMLMAIALRKDVPGFEAISLFLIDHVDDFIGANEFLLQDSYHMTDFIFLLIHFLYLYLK